MDGQIVIQQVLKEKFTEYQIKNPQFSLRAFAKKMGVAASSLSLIMLGKRRISRNMAIKLANKLLLGPIEKKKLLDGFKDEKGGPSKVKSLQLSDDQFNIISQWHYFGLLNLIKTANFKSDLDWMSTRLDLPLKKIKDALARLLRLNLVKKNEEGHFERCRSSYRTTDGVSSMALRKSHHETLELASRSLERDGLTKRDFTWLTLVFDPAKMDIAKDLIRKFQDEFIDTVQDKAVNTEVYRLGIQLFPLTKLEGENCEKD